MPSYLYRCDQCGCRFEAVQPLAAPPLAVCPECDGPARRLIQPVAIRFKGPGFHVNDYAPHRQE